MRSGRKGLPLIRLALMLTALLASLTLVIWRQSQALEMLRELEMVRQERVLEEARRSGHARHLEQLESRARVSVAARDRLGMRVPTGAELVILPLLGTAPPALAVSDPPSAKGGG